MVSNLGRKLEEEFKYREKRGIEKGIQQGIEKGIQQGIEKGIQQGIEKGIQQGIEKGIQQGIEKGIQQGIEKGIQQGKIEMVRNLLLLGVDIEKIVKASDLSKEEIEKKLNQGDGSCGL
jgi:flagellar biosynthesis/type III secretory pathway protein FliH